MFDTPNNLDGTAKGYEPTAQGRILTKQGKPFATYREWQLGANIMGPISQNESHE
jgi:hypothetical protein